MTATAVTPRDLVGPVAMDIRGAAAQAEAERRLPRALMSKLKDAGLFSIYTPRGFGGLELALPEALAVVEEVARHDGSTGWTVALGVANGYFTTVLGREAAARVLGGGGTLIAGAPAFGVRAVRVPGGYRLTGRWSFNSGAPNADWIGAPAPVFEGEAPVMDDHGQPELVFFFITPSEAEIIDTWHVTGLRASGTQDLYVEDVFVSEEMTGDIELPAGPKPVWETPLARMPLFSLLHLAQSPPVCLGLARRAIEEFRALAMAKPVPFSGARLFETVQAQAGLARAEALVRSARGYWYGEVRPLWERVERGAELSTELLCDVRLASLLAVESCTDAVGLLYRLSGTSAIFQTSPLERCWRDIHTAAQHLGVQDGRWETTGRVLFGMVPGSPLV
ncbi:acyl-CoA dehydrogenase family protein [Tepidiforma sp.]|uniref:acyl-CoA dehydrogenase family protein n=1 Tax=Tepidiforma sp. TaxID=2682230 RepID=UPI002ADD835D|nr:acyl-CoA dehydrogenase family protein [Tepidiforma sp.]